MNLKQGIHDYKKHLNRQIELMKNSNLSKKNKQLIFNYDQQLRLDGLSIPRRIRVMGALRTFCLHYLKRDLDKATKDNLKKAILKIEDKEDYSPYTISSFKGIVKKFYKFFEYGDTYKQKDGYPPKVAWINPNVKAKDQPRIQASEILTEAEIKKLIDVATNIRDKCFIAMLYELGARISEIGNLRLKDITKDKYGYIVDLHGKTGHRTPRIIFADPYVSLWLNEHPLRHDLNAPLWVVMGNKNTMNKMLNYSGLRKVIKTLVGKAGIKKRVYPHLFRHTRVTHLLSTGKINEAQAKVYFGWTPASNMLSEYAHLVSRDVNEAILEIHGIVKEENEESALKTKLCYRCKKINKPEDIFCPSCGAILDEKTSFKIEETNQLTDFIIGERLKKGQTDFDQTMKELLQEVLRKIEKGKDSLEVSN